MVLDIYIMTLKDGIGILSLVGTSNERRSVFPSSRTMPHRRLLNIQYTLILFRLMSRTTMGFLQGIEDIP